MTTKLLPVIAVGLLVASQASADDLADEADLQFRLGAKAFEAHDYSGALEHFLASNRLVPNRNVAFNVASTYESLGMFPEAYRYFTADLAEEIDPGQRTAIEVALKRIRPHVAVLRVVTTPPGATLFVDRRDLGPRGSSPGELALPPGDYLILAELAGYRSAQSPAIHAVQGTSQEVDLPLERVVGEVEVSGTPAGMVLHLEEASAPALGTAPGHVRLAPGRHRLVATAPGFRDGDTWVDVHEGEVTKAQIQLEPLRGEVVVRAEPIGARLMVDGHLEGFAPAVLHLPVGAREVEVSSPGFRPVTNSVQVSTAGQATLEVALTQLEQVSGASRTSETLDQAPSSVSIVTGEEIAAMNYPTIAEAVRGVRGVFLSDDRTYTSVGMRGFGPAGSYGNRVLIMQDGHIANDDWIEQSYSGFDARSDLSDVKRIEVIRGPGSVLYGTGAITGVINLITDDRDSPSKLDATLSSYDNGTYVAHATARERYSDTMGASATVGAATGNGRDFYFPDLAAAGLNPISDGADGFSSENVRLKGWLGPLSLAANYNLRDKSAPTGEYDTFVGDGRTQFIDGRSFVELRYEPHLSETLQLLSRAYFDRYTYNSSLYGTEANGGLRQETYLGLWGGGEVRLAFTPIKGLRLQAGGEGQYHGTTLETGVAYVGEPSQATYLHRSDPFAVGAVYALGDWDATQWLAVTIGARLDAFSTFGTSLNPRAAIIAHPYSAGTLKLMAGRAFRAPSIYELYYNDGGLTQLPGCTTNPCTLRPEEANTGELEFTHHLGETWSLLGTVYTNYITDLIVLRSLPDDPAVAQYSNTQVPVLTLGAEAEVRREWRHGWMASASYAYQHSEYVQPASTPADQLLRQVPNSPNHLASVRFGMPIIGTYLSGFTRLTAESGRYDVHDEPTDPPQQHTQPSLVWDLVLSGALPEYHVRYSVGAYNLANAQYSVPVSTEFAPINSVVQDGRTFMAKLSVEL